MSNSRAHKRRRQHRKTALVSLPVGEAARPIDPNKRLKAYVLPADEWACGAYRLRWPAEQVGLQTDIEVQVVDKGSSSFTGLQAKIGQDPLTGKQRMAQIGFYDDADIFVIQRPTNRWLAEAVQALRYAGITVVVDIDDDLARIHPSNPAFVGLHPRNTSNPDIAWRWAELACKHASLVTVSTPALAERYGKHGRVAILPNMVPERVLDLPRHDHGPLTWCGSLHSHPNDLDVLGTSVRDLVRDNHWFSVVGEPLGVGYKLGLPVDPKGTGTLPLDQWHAHVASSQVTIAPLAETAFNQAKSWLKVLEAAGCGVPFVASDRIEYHRFVNQTGVGFLADKPKDWYSNLRRLLTEPALRQEQSELGRAAVKARYTLEANAWRWAEAWQEARKIDLRERTAHVAP
jgi:glycosyltransferase involved in cell wall biosynthesis